MSSRTLPIERARTASFDVDAQCCFTPLCPQELPVPGGDEIAAALNAQAGYARWRLGSKDAHSAHAAWICGDRAKIAQAIAPEDNPAPAELDVYWPRHAEPGTPGFALVPGLPAPSEYDFFVWKGVEPLLHPYGACYHDRGERLSTGVIEFLRQRQVDTVLVGGLALDYCVKTTALQLARAGLRVIVHLAACRALSASAAEHSLHELAQAGVRWIEQLDELQPQESAA